MRFEENRGFAVGMNAGLERAAKPFVVFLNSDTEVPAGWVSKLCEHLDDPDVGLAVPAVTRAGVPVTVRARPGADVIVLDPFSQPPSGVVYAMRTETARALGGFSERYGLGGGEDLDLCFCLWVNNLEIVLDTRVLVAHVAKATSRTVFPDWTKHLDRTADTFIALWRSSERSLVRLDGCDAGTFERNRRTASSVAEWMGKYVHSRRAARFVGHSWVRRAIESLFALRRRAITGVRTIRAQS